MYTLCIQYRLDPTKLEAFRSYASSLRAIVDRCGGHFVDYFLPTKLAGPTDCALGLIDLPDLAAYECYRHCLEHDEEAIAVTRKVNEAGSILSENRSLLERAQSAQQQPEPAVGRAEYGDAPGPSPIERMYFTWDKTLESNDPEALLALYDEDAELESPLVAHLLGTERGALRGHDELRQLFEILAERKPPVRRYYRTGYLSDGKRFMWEYPRSGPDGEQMDFVEVMELNHRGLIQRHRVYWGWLGFGILQRDEYRRS
jgi:NIPSNAP/SnoaL-like domain